MRPLPAGEPWGDYAVSTARWKGALLHEVLEQAAPHQTGVEVRFAGADHGSYILNPVLKDIDASDLSFERSLTLVHAADPSAEILIAYEMNGEPLNPDHGSPFRLDRPALVWRRLGQVAEADRSPDRTIHRRVRDRPLHVSVARSPGRARDGDATAGADNRAGPGRRRERSVSTCVVRGKAWSGTGPVTNVDLSLTGEARVATGAPRDPERSVPVAELVIRMAADRTRPKDAARTGYGRGGKRAARSSDLEPARLRQQRDRGRLRRRSIAPAAKTLHGHPT